MRFYVCARETHVMKLGAPADALIASRMAAAFKMASGAVRVENGSRVLKRLSNLAA